MTIYLCPLTNNEQFRSIEFLNNYQPITNASSYASFFTFAIIKYTALTPVSTNEPGVVSTEHAHNQLCNDSFV